MAEIEVATFEQIATILSQLSNNYSNLAINYYDIFYNPVPQDVTIQLYDAAGVLKDYVIPNRAKDFRFVLNGEGSPEGVVSAGVGSTYQDTLNGRFYIKQLGEDNKGWVEIASEETLVKGEGAPEGILVKSKGTLYVDATTGTLYIKTTATGSTGWLQVSHDENYYAKSDLSNLNAKGEAHFANPALTNLNSFGEAHFANPSLSNLNSVGKNVINSKENVSNKVTTISDSSTNIQYPSARAVNTAIKNVNVTIKNVQQELEGKKANIELDNLSVKGEQRIDTSKMYKTGEVTNDVRGYNELSQWERSTFDKSKFTVIGSPTITDDGIASGFSNSNYLEIPTIDRSKPFVQTIVYTPLAKEASGGLYVEKTGSVYLSRLTFIPGTNIIKALLTESGTSWDIGEINPNIDLKIGETYKIEFGYIGTKYYLKIYQNDTLLKEKELISNKKMRNVPMILGKQGNFQANGSIDLKQFSISVDGKEVFNGNKTGIDVIKKDNFTKIGNPIISDDGIVTMPNFESYIQFPVKLEELAGKTWYIEGTSYIDGTSDSPIIKFGDTGYINTYSCFYFNMGYKSFLVHGVAGSKNGVATAESEQIWIPKDGYFGKYGVGYYNWRFGYNYNTSTYELYLSFGLGTPLKLEKSWTPKNLDFPEIKSFGTNGTFHINYGSSIGGNKQFSNGPTSLNSIKIYVDGNLVYQPCLRIPYTLTSNNSKIVPASYRGAVEQFYEEFSKDKFESYYTIDHENKNITLPHGEIYGMIETARKEVNNAVKGYETGEVTNDERLYNELIERKRSTFDKSKFTVVGTPTITNDGIASGFNSSNHINTARIDVSPNNRWYFKTKIHYKTTGQYQMVASTPQAQYSFLLAFSTENKLYGAASSNGQSWDIFDDVSSKGSHTFLDNKDYYVKFEYTGTEYIISYSVDDINYTTQFEFASGLKIKNIATIQIGTLRDSSYPFDGLIDLKQLSISIDGKEVFSGNKTGLDIIKPDNFTVIGNPTISGGGIASGFNAQNYLIHNSNISVDDAFAICCNVNLSKKAPYDSTVFQFKGTVSQAFRNRLAFYQNGMFGVSVYLKDGTNTFEALRFNETAELGEYKFKFSYDKIKYTLEVLRPNGTKASKILVNSSPINITNGDIQIGRANGGTDNESFKSGSIDLNAFKVYTNGDLTSQLMLKIPYTESSTGSKIVDSIYRDRVQDVYEQYGKALYYTIDEENKNSSLPSGELYGMVEGVKNEIEKIGETTRASETYENKGELLTDSEGYADVEKYYRSTFNREAFLLVGSPTLSDNGILTNEALSPDEPTKGLETSYKIGILKDKSWSIQIGFTMQPSTSIPSILSFGRTWSAFGSLGALVDNGVPKVSFSARTGKKGDPNNEGAKITLTGRIGEEIIAKVAFDKDSGTYTLSLSTLSGEVFAFGKWVAPTSPQTSQQLYTIDEFPNRYGIGILTERATDPEKRKITVDLKQYELNIEGEVFSGNKTGLDILKENDYSVVGNPVISDGGVASNFWGGGKIEKSGISLSPKKDIYFEFKLIYKNEPHSENVNQHVFRFLCNNVYLGYQTDRNVLVFDQKSKPVIKTLYLNTDFPELKEGDEIFFSFYKDINELNYEITCSANGIKKVYYDNNGEITNWNFPTTDFFIGYYEGLYGYAGGIDLNTLKIYVDGNLVYQPCLRIPYHESTTGDKIVPVEYRDRILDAHNQGIKGSYYTIDTEAKNFTAPLGSGTMNEADKDLRQLSKFGNDKLTISKMYETGEISRDEKAVNQLIDMKYSTFDRSKVNVKGNPTIDAAGIATNLDTNNQIILCKSSEITTSKEWEIQTKFTVADMGATYRQLITANVADTFRFIINRDYSCRILIKTEAWGSTETDILSAGTQVYIGHTYIAKIVRHKGVYQFWLAEENRPFSLVGEAKTDLEPPVSENNMIVSTGDALILDKIDLKHTFVKLYGKARVDYNKTGIDAIKSDNFEKVGNPVISDDGVASGFSGTSAFKFNINDFSMSNHWEIIVPYEFTGNEGGQNFFYDNSTIDISGTATGYSFYILVRFLDTEGGDSILLWKSSGGNELNVKYMLKLVYDSISGYSVFRKRENGNWNLEASNSITKKIKPITTYNFLGNAHYLGGNYLRGSIDFNEFKIYVDGNLVYQPLLRVPYTKTKTGSNIVDAQYRDRVEDTKEYTGSALYYTLDEENRTCTLPKGEIYGFIGDTVVEHKTYPDGSWYRQYRSGWLEQGGIVLKEKGGHQVVNFLRAYKDTNYTLTIGTVRLKSGGGVPNALYDTKTKTSFNISLDYASEDRNNGCTWHTCGQGEI